jgi:hypothetical protein
MVAMGRTGVATRVDRLWLGSESRAIPNAAARPGSFDAGGADKEADMFRTFDGTFWIGSLLVGLALAIVVATMRSVEVPILGNGRLALLAVGLLGLAACTTVGSMTTPGEASQFVDWSRPTSVFGLAMGLLATAILIVGLIGIEPVFRPLAQMVPAAVATGEGAAQRLAIVALGAIIAAKWIVGIALTTVHVLRPG